jgi:dynein heavy chain, axonemal
VLAGVYVHGLFMEGARFDRGAMVVEESLPGALFDTMPCIWFKPRKTTEDDGSGAGVYSCPLYKTSKRAGAWESSVTFTRGGIRCGPHANLLL